MSKTKTETNVNVAIVASVIAIVISMVAVGVSISEQDNIDMVNTQQLEQMQVQIDALLIRSGTHVHDQYYEDENFLNHMDDKYLPIDTYLATLDVIDIIVDNQVNHQGEIIKNRDTIKDNHPFDFEPEETAIDEPARVGSSTLSIYLEKDNWLQGETVVFTGNAVSFAGQVEAFVNGPEDTVRYLEQVVGNDGEYVIRMHTEFDAPLGNYTVYVEQGNKISETVTFTLSE